MIKKYKVTYVMRSYETYYIEAASPDEAEQNAMKQGKEEDRWSSDWLTSGVEEVQQ